MKMALASALVVLGVVTGSAATPVDDNPPPMSRPRVEGGKASIDDLIAGLLQALAANDRDALRRLRFSEAEYREIIHPGSAEPGQPFKQVSTRGSDFAWGLLNTKSMYYEQFLLSSFGGRRLTVREVKFAGGEKAYAGYRAHKQLRLALETDDGQELLLRTGSIGEVDGQFKFISFIRD